jgi:hypothetical protein
MTQEALKLALEALEAPSPSGQYKAITAIKEALYTTPPQRTWQELTDEDISEIVRGTHNTGSFVRAIEAKLKEKNCAG